ncbi:helix-turn-helix domain-containing protein [Ochrobactrum sp. MYb379]|uniref:helix-turn-helix domain-containing protein n=1 Tax=Ochrobactrum sp. MYb379 TaxID=2745275 RepID=UPI00403F50BA
MDTIARVRRAVHVQGWTVKKITRELHVSRNTVRKILRSDATEFSYKREHQPFPKIEPWKGDVERFLISNEGKASHAQHPLARQMGLLCRRID